jgi:cytosine/adenosine deaminase-related metal-dependent hydrolase
MGLDPLGIAPGRQADLVAVRAATLREAMAMMPPARHVLSRGRLVTGETED